ncbi:hypothetical protein KP509_13G095200 [Ceratopteris richardii]|uniref:Folylpolyglutamate synthase n=1 Tax=Ceratopteris richardii TaxID=49495 RepID=A0A8T2TFY9_CERRI|nr:hypothetical protein KP509_13G095200 [Ceratopteris richardii]
MPFSLACSLSLRRRRALFSPSSSSSSSHQFTHRRTHSMSFQDAIATLNKHLARPRPTSTGVTSSTKGPSQNVISRFSLLPKYIEALELQESLSHLSVIHVAGTKGKGSTCAFTENILRSCGYRTGLFTSPHLVDIRERFRFNGDLVSEEVFAKHFWWCWNRLQAVESSTLPMPWFFAFLTLLALKMFTLENVDVAILEVGVGGCYDATNVVPQPAVCGIASLGYDHMDVLGSTLSEIAAQKAGIFKAGVPAFSVPQPAEALEVLHKKARDLSVPLEITQDVEFYGVKSLKLGLDGDHQRTNAALAVALCAEWEKNHFSKKYSSFLEEGHLPDAYLQGLATTRWPGRGQIIYDVGFHSANAIKYTDEGDQKAQKGRLTLYLDGAHTAESLGACANWFSSSVLSGALKDKNNDVNIPNYKKWSSSNGCQDRGIMHKLCYQRVLVFNCMAKRDPQLLLPCLIKKCRQNGLQIDIALFVPPLSTSDAIETRSVSDICATAMEAEPDLSWQHLLQRVWESHQEPDKGSKAGSSIGLSWLRQYLNAGGHNRLHEQCVISTSSVVIPSLPVAIDWLRYWASQDLVELQVLVTGSLYLVGDLLKIHKHLRSQHLGLSWR